MMGKSPACNPSLVPAVLQDEERDMLWFLPQQNITNSYQDGWHQDLIWLQCWNLFPFLIAGLLLALFITLIKRCVALNMHRVSLAPCWETSIIGWLWVFQALWPCSEGCSSWRFASLCGWHLQRTGVGTLSMHLFDPPNWQSMLST